MNSLRCFIGYAREDSHWAEMTYDALKAAGHAPWLDIKHLAAGQNWEVELARALRDSDVVIILLSKHSVSKRGFFQKEIKAALERVQYRLEDDIYIIPARLDEVNVPDQLSKWQWVDLYASTGMEKLIQALRLQAARLAQADDRSRGTPSVLSWITERYEEQRDGYPGYLIEMDLITFTSTSAPDAARQLTEVIRGKLSTLAMSERKIALSPDVEYFGKWDTQQHNYYILSGPSVRLLGQRIVSLDYLIEWYGAGAAHPNTAYLTFNALLEPLCLLDVGDLFLNRKQGVILLSSLVIPKLAREFETRVGACDAHDLIEIERGAGPDESNFASFVFDKDGLRFLFPPYQVGPYALGSFAVEIHYAEIKHVLAPYIVNALDPT